jgi:clan AA aspartic protease (TIGR02281 family)
MSGCVLLYETKTPRNPARLAWMLVTALSVAGAVSAVRISRDRQPEQPPVGVPHDRATTPPTNPARHDERPPLATPQLSVPIDASNQCHVEATVNGASSRFLIDTGAFGIIFPIARAKKLGLYTTHLHFDHTYREWGGSVRGTTVHLHEMRLGSFVARDVEAVIDNSTFTDPLLGVSFLKLVHFEMSDGFCKFWW